MNRLIVLGVLLIASLAAAAGQPSAQGNRDARDDAAAARRDALTATPNRATPVSQTNLFSTSPRLEQQLRATDEKPGQGQPGMLDHKSS
jgi:hypothetical protein